LCVPPSFKSRFIGITIGQEEIIRCHLLASSISEENKIIIIIIINILFKLLQNTKRYNKVGVATSIKYYLLKLYFVFFLI
jgi:hypothetical protein